MEVKSISTTEEWNDSKIQTLSYGGNSRFDEFLAPYLSYLGQDKYQVNVFQLCAAEFYRKRLNAFINIGYFSEAPPSLEDGAIIESYSELVSELVVDSETGEIKDKLDDHRDERLARIQDEDEDVVDKLGSNLKELWETTGDIFQDHTKAAWESTAGFREKVSTGTKSALSKTGEVAGETWDKTKEISKSTWSITGDFFRSLGQKASGAIDSVKETETVKKSAEIVSEVKAKTTTTLFGWFGSSAEPDQPEEAKEEVKEENVEDGPAEPKSINLEKTNENTQSAE